MRLCLLLCVLLLAACDSDDSGKPAAPAQGMSLQVAIGPAGGSAKPDGGLFWGVMLSGTVTYEELIDGPAGLGNPILRPARGVLVEAVRHDSLTMVLAQAYTDAAGQYSLSLFTNADFYVRARAQDDAVTDTIRVFNALTPAPYAVHAVSSPILDRTQAGPMVDLHAALASQGGAVNRSGAFAILDTLRRLRDAVALALGPLDVFWAHGGNNVMLTTGRLDNSGTMMMGPNGLPTIQLLGGDWGNAWGTDHDEYDITVIAHEWASFVQLTQSRDNNFGGPHAGEELIYTASYSEGVVTAIGCALLDRRVYRDTYGLSGSSGVLFEFDLESGLLPGGGTGYGNEFAIARVVWDILDGAPGGPADFDSDGVAVPMADFMASFTALRTRAGTYEICWLASLLQQLIDDGHLTLLQADTLMAAHGAQFPPSGPDPFPDLLPGTVTGALDAFSGDNPVLGPQANAVYRLSLSAPGNVSLALSNTTAGFSAAAHRLELSVFNLSRMPLGFDGGQSATAGLQLALPAGTYIVRIQHRPDSAATAQPAQYSLTLN